MGAHAQNIQGDDANRLTLLSNKQSDDDVVSSFASSVDKTGNRTKLTLSNGDYAEYVYDQTYQLTREHRKDSENATLYYNNFFYDPAGNRTRLEYNDGTSTTTTSYLYNTADQLTRESVGETNTAYLYDANGNLTKKDDGSNVHAYGYDFRNLMTSYDGPGSTNDTTYTYDAWGRRVTKNVNGTKTAYVHDGLDTVAEYNGSNQLQRTYVTPGLDQNLSLTASGNTYYYLSDALGSIRQVLDADQSTQNSYDYEAFGSVYGSPTENVTQPFRFTGREWDGESGLHYYRARNYEAQRGRFVSRDPAIRSVQLADSSPYIEIELSSQPTRVVEKTAAFDPAALPMGYDLYALAGNRPVDFTDPSGLQRNREGADVALRWGVAGVLAAKGATDEALSESRSSGFAGPEDGPQDALRHCLWSCYMVTYYPFNPFGGAGPTFSKWVTDNHEARLPSSKPGSNQMDYYNNAVGRSLGSQVWNSQVQGSPSCNCYDACLCALMTGMLMSSPRGNTYLPGMITPLEVLGGMGTPRR